MNTHERKFVRTVTEYYKLHGRHSLPWRTTKNPYKILVSEIMLQQTQVDRVIPKYTAFLHTFPTLNALADASLGEVLIQWQGLGYNRRAKMLHACAQIIVTEYKGKFPKTLDVLLKLPGVGHYTAGAVMAFAYNTPVPIIETNIRSVFLHHFFKTATNVTDAELSQLTERFLDRGNPREWYYALMDYGSFIKKEFGNPNSKSSHYVKQSAFEGSDRQIRGAVVRLLGVTGGLTRVKLLIELLQYEDIRVDAQVEKLLAEGLIVSRNRRLLLP